MKTKLTVGMSLLVTSAFAFSQEVTDAYGPFNLDGGKVACKSTSGDEIKKTQVYTAPQDRYFTSFAASPISGVSFVGPAECPILDKATKKVKLTLQNGLVVDVDVPVSYTVMAHADCGSGERRTLEHIAKGEHINVECSVSGTLMKYTK